MDMRGRDTRVSVSSVVISTKYKRRGGEPGRLAQPSSLALIFPGRNPQSVSSPSTAWREQIPNSTFWCVLVCCCLTNLIPLVRIRPSSACVNSSRSGLFIPC